MAGGCRPSGRGSGWRTGSRRRRFRASTTSRTATAGRAGVGADAGRRLDPPVPPRAGTSRHQVHAGSPRLYSTGAPSALSVPDGRVPVSDGRPRPLCTASLNGEAPRWDLLRSSARAGYSVTSYLAAWRGLEGLSGRRLVQFGQERIDDAWVELVARAAVEFGPRVSLARAGGVRAGGDHREVGIAGEHDPGRQRDVLAFESVGVAAAVVPATKRRVVRRDSRSRSWGCRDISAAPT